MSMIFFVVLSCVGRGLAMGRSPVQGVVPVPNSDFYTNVGT